MSIKTFQADRIAKLANKDVEFDVLEDQKVFEDHLETIGEIVHCIDAKTERDLGVPLYLYVVKTEMWGKNVNLVVTYGMSTEKVNYPGGNELYEFNEISIVLPDSWPVDIESWTDDTYYWPIHLLQEIVFYSISEKKWMSVGHTYSSGSFLGNTGFNSVLLFFHLNYSIEQMLVKCKNRVINICNLTPLYPEEYDYIKKNGRDAFIDLLMSKEMTSILDVDRESLV